MTATTVATTGDLLRTLAAAHADLPQPHNTAVYPGDFEVTVACATAVDWIDWQVWFKRHGAMHWRTDSRPLGSGTVRSADCRWRGWGLHIGHTKLGGGES